MPPRARRNRLQVRGELLQLAGVGEVQAWYVGEEISDELEEGDNILYVSEPYHAMHRLYTLQITVDPDHDREITGYWADYEYNWSHILEDSDIDWVIFTDDWQSYLDDSWTEFDTDTDYLIYHRKTAL